MTPTDDRVGWWCISDDSFLWALRRAANGEDPDLLYAELYANTYVETVKGDD